MRHQNVCLTILEHGRWFGDGVDVSVILVVIERWTSPYVSQYPAQVCPSEAPRSSVTTSPEERQCFGFE